MDTLAPGMARLVGRAEHIRAAARRHRGTGRVLVFGSVARGDDGPGSDVDLLVEFAEGASLFDQVALEDELADLLGTAVDVMSLGAQGRAADHARTHAVELR